MEITPELQEIIDRSVQQALEERQAAAKDAAEAAAVEDEAAAARRLSEEQVAYEAAQSEARRWEGHTHTYGPAGGGGLRKCQDDGCPAEFHTDWIEEG